MTTASSVATQEKFTNLRKRLDQLGYRQPLGVESLPLVERLFTDLVHTTENLKKTKLELAKAPVDQENIECHVEAYKSDNGKLLKENNELHQQLIKVKEDGDTLIKDLRSSLRKLEHENADLRFLNNQYVHKIQSLESESKQKSDKILQLQEKNLHAVVQTPNGRKKNIPFRRQRMEIDSVVPESQPKTGSQSTRTDPYIADLLQVADSNIGKLREQCRILEEEKEGLMNKVDHFRQQVQTRDLEVDRLTNLLEGGRPYDVVALESKNRQNERTISHLNIQVDYLQQKCEDLERQLTDAVEKAHRASNYNNNLGSRNMELETELESVDKMAHRLQQDKDSLIREAGREIENIKRKWDEGQLEVDRLQQELNLVSAEKDEAKRQLEEAEELVQRTQEDKKKQSQRINKLIANEKELVLEIDRLKHRKNGMKKSGKMDEYHLAMKDIEEDRDYWRSETEVLQKLLRTKARPRSPRSGSRSESPCKVMSRSRSPSPAKSAKQVKMESTIKRLEEDLAHSKHENEILKSLNSKGLKQSKTDASTTNIEEILQERDELKGMISKFERHLAEIQANVKVLTTERDKLDCLYQKSKEELAYLRKEIVKSPQKPRTSVAAQAVLRRVENERDEALAELRRASTERDTLRERLKIATNTHLNDRAALEQRIEDLEKILEQVESQRNEGDDHNVLLQKNVDQLEKDFAIVQSQLDNSKADSKQLRSTVSQLKTMLSESETTLKDTQNRLARRDSDLQSARDRMKGQEEVMTDLQLARQADTKEINRLRSSLSSLDKLKDTLEIAVDDKTIRISGLEEDLRQRDQQLGNQRETIAGLDRSVQQLRDILTDKDREISSLQRQLDASNRELEDCVRSREVAVRENRRLMDDLTSMTRENQSLSQDLAGAFQDLDDLKTKVQENLLRIKQLDDLVIAKDEERADLLVQYRAVNQECESIQSKSQSLESEGSTLKLELMTKDQELRRLREEHEQLQLELRQSQKSCRAYEQKMSDMSKSISALEVDVRGAEQQKYNVQQELFTIRDLCARLERSKDEIQRQLTAKNIDNEKLNSLVDDMHNETAHLRAQVGSERDAVYNLEGLIQSTRDKEYRVCLEIQEKDAEIQLLKDRVAINDSKLESQSRELTLARNRLIELESDLERLKRNVTSERFERERLAQELRRHSIPVPGETRLARSSTSGQERVTSPVPRSKSPFRYTSPK